MATGGVIRFEARAWTREEAEALLVDGQRAALERDFPYEVRPILDALVACPTLTAVDLSGARELLNPDVEHLVETAQQLEDIELRDCPQIGDAAVMALGRALGPALKRLRLDGAAEVTDAGVFALRNCVCLEELSLAGLRAVTPKSLSYVLQTASDLQDLILDECQVTDALLKDLSAAPPPLRRLSLAGCRMVSDAGAIPLLKACPALRSLSLHNIPKLTDQSLGAAAVCCPDIEEIDIGWNDNFTDTGVQALGQRCKSLHTVRMAGCRELTSRALLHVAMLVGPRLAELDILRCEKVSDNGPRCIADKCPNVRSLRIGFCCRLTDESVRALGSGLRSVTDLDLSNIRLLSDGALAAGIEPLADSLERLNLYSCARLTDEAAGAVARCRRLRRLVLSFVGELSDEGLAAVARGCPELEELEVSSCRLLTDGGVAAAAGALPRLRLLNAAGVRLTDAGVDALGPPLACVDVRECTRVTPAAAERLRSRLPLGAVVRTSHWAGAGAVARPATGDAQPGKGTRATREETGWGRPVI
eukprot:tig00020909_g15329.t1